MKAGDLLNGKYKIIKKLQDGGQATLYLAIVENDSLSFTKEVAIKIFDKEEGSQSDFLSEVKLLSELNHPNIAKILDVGTVNEKPYLVLEYINGLNLRELREKSFIKRIDISVGDIFVIFENILDALIYSHTFKSNPILHRDISPSNIMISTDGFVKLLDFGVSEVSIDKLVGKPAYLPQAVLNKEESYSEKSELYSLGVVIYELVTLKKVKNEEDIDIQNVQNKKLRAILKKILKDKDPGPSDILKEVRKTRNDYYSNLSLLVKKSIDDEYIVDSTYKHISKTTPIRRPKNKLIFIVIGIFSIVTSYASYTYFKENGLGSDLKWYLQGDPSRPPLLIEAPGPDLIIPMSKEQKLSFVENACNNYCYQSLMNIAVGHKDFFDLARKDPSYGITYKNYESYFNNYVNLYRDTRSHNKAYEKVCAKAVTCIVLKGTHSFIDMRAPSGMSDAEFNRNFQKILNGTDKDFVKIAGNLNSGRYKPGTKNYVYTVVPRAPGSFQNIIEFEGDLDSQTCLDIGDEAFLKLSMFKKQEEETFLLNDFDTVILNKKLSPKYQGDKDKIPLYSVTLPSGVKEVTACHYLRSEGVLSILQIWNITF